MGNSDIAEAVEYTTPKFVKPKVVPKYFALDVDGTFKTANDVSQDKNIAALRDAIKKGISLFFCTGRPLHTLINNFKVDFIKHTGYNGFPGVYCNGALVYGDDGSIISKLPFSRKFLEDFVTFIQENNTVHCVLFIGIKEPYSLVPNTTIVDLHIRVFGADYTSQVITPQQLFELDIVTINTAGAGFLDSMQGYVAGVDYISNDCHGMSNISPGTITKAQGLVTLCNHKGINPKDVGFIGDGLNDVEIMKQSDLSFAVGNAPPKVKESAKYVLHETNDEAAFARAISLVYE